MKKSNRVDRKKLILELDDLASQLCRLQWHYKCAMCGGPGTQTHHFFGKKAHGGARWDHRNLIWLCFACHIYKVHSKGDTEPARDAIINRIGQRSFDLLKTDAKIVRKYSINSLQDIRDYLIRDRIGETARQAQDAF
jgi:5-methylcytosine-specific restriction endonuclease McrA